MILTSKFFFESLRHLEEPGAAVIIEFGQSETRYLQQSVFGYRELQGNLLQQLRRKNESVVVSSRGNDWKKTQYSKSTDKKWEI